MKRIMKRAHELAKVMEGDYQARLALGLKQAWKETKEVKLEDVREIVKTDGNANWDAREWANYGKVRVYLNFKGKGQGFLEIVDGVIKNIEFKKASLGWMRKSLDKFIGKQYKFGA